MVPVGRLVRHVQGQRVVRFREAGIESVGEHRGGAAEALLGRLHHEHHGAAPALAQRRKLPRRRQLRGDVHVVAAGVHHRRFDAVDADLPHLRGVGHARTLFERQAVHVGAHQHRGPVAVLQHRDDASAADALRDLHAGDCAQLLRHPRGCLRLAVREFRIAVKVIPERAERTLVIGRDGLGVIGLGCGGQGGAERQGEHGNAVHEGSVVPRMGWRARRGQGHEPGTTLTGEPGRVDSVPAASLCRVE